jgi:hypothetical protein
MSVTGELTAIVRALARLVAALEPQGATAMPDPPEPPEPAPRPGFKPGSQEWYASLPPPRTDEGISMNALARTVPKPKPPRKPSWER